MKIFFIFILCFLISICFAERGTYTITCNQDTLSLSDEFVKNQWVKTIMPWYFSWAKVAMDGYLFGGGMRTIKDKYPKDPNPHLRFLNPVVVYDEEQGEILMCRYKIENPEMMDIDDNLEMRYFSYLSKNACFVSSYSTITCTESSV